MTTKILSCLTKCHSITQVCKFTCTELIAPDDTLFQIFCLYSSLLQCNDRAMIRQICSIKPEDVATVRSSELLVKLELEDLDLILRERRLRWFGHVERSSGAIRTACDIQIDGRRGAGRLKLTWKKLT